MIFWVSYHSNYGHAMCKIKEAPHAVQRSRTWPWDVRSSWQCTYELPSLWMCASEALLVITAGHYRWSSLLICAKKAIESSYARTDNDNAYFMDCWSRVAISHFIIRACLKNKMCISWKKKCGLATWMDRPAQMGVIAGNNALCCSIRSLSCHFLIVAEMIAKKQI